MIRLRALWRRRRWLRSLFSTIYFNFHYLPLRQAYKLPIILYKPVFLELKGKIILDSKKIKPGMIQLGFPRVSVYPNSGIVFENHGGTCIFNGNCNIGNSSAISIGTSGHLKFGNNFSATASFKIICYFEIEFNENVVVGWDNVFMDTDLHKMTRTDGTFTNGYGSVVIGRNNWFGLRCTTLKNTQTPDYCTIAANSVLNKKYVYSSYTLIGGNPAELKATGIYLDINNDKINYLDK